MQNTDFRNQFSAVVFAAGKGTRIGQRMPKVLHPLVGKPMIFYTLDLIKKVPIENCYVVLGFSHQDVAESIKLEHPEIVIQQEQLGTAHALQTALSGLKHKSKYIIVFNGDDSAFFDVVTMRKFTEEHIKTESKVSFITANVKNPTGLGRIVRDSQNQIRSILEEKAANEEEKLIKEVNVGCYIFDVDWVTEALPKITKSVSGEYYITDLVKMAIESNESVNAFELLNLNEWKSVNTIAELDFADEEMFSKLVLQKEPRVFIFGIDNTLLNTDKLKEHVKEEIVPKMFSSEIQKAFWQGYDDAKKELGFASILDFSVAFAEKYNDPNYVNIIRKVFYDIKFQDFVFDGVDNLFDYIDPKGEIAIFTEGDLIFQPIKIKNLSLYSKVDEMFVFEHKMQNAFKIAAIYHSRKKVFIDDKITELENFKRVSPDAVTIHIKQGSYKDLIPMNEYFKADYTANNLNEVFKIVSSFC